MTKFVDFLCGLGVLTLGVAVGCVLTKAVITVIQSLIGFYFGGGN